MTQYIPSDPKGQKCAETKSVKREDSYDDQMSNTEPETITAGDMQTMPSYEATHDLTMCSPGEVVNEVGALLDNAVVFCSRL
jgi:hypothetical protein